MKNQFEAFIDDLRGTHGKNLVSVILYGSAASGDFIPKRSDYNTLVALRRITPQDLRDANPTIREWHKLGHPVPVYFTVSELQNAADVFPIEFLHMESARKVLYGSDVLADMQITEAALRRQTEYELRGKLIRLRRSYVAASASAGGLEHLMLQSLTSFAALFRAVLVLSKKRPPPTKHETVALAASELGLDFLPFEKIFNIRQDNFGLKLDEAEANRLFADYIAEIEKVIDVVDRMPG